MSMNKKKAKEVNLTSIKRHIRFYGAPCYDIL